MLQLTEHNMFIFKQDKVPSHFGQKVCEFLNATLPNHWLGRATAKDGEGMKWTPRSPDLTPCHFFLWGYVQEKVHVTPLLLDTHEMKLRIITAIDNMHRNMSERVWDELD
jgi:hypothetical protein